MPEPIKAAPATQSEQTASTPAPHEATQDKPTTETKPEKAQTEPAWKGMLDSLDLPDDIKAKVAPKPEVQPAPPEPAKAESEPEPPAPPPTAEEPEVKEEADEEDDDAVAEVEKKQATGQELTKTERKLLKRVRRLARQKSDLETRLDTIASDLEKVQGERKTEEVKPADVPSQNPVLGHINDETTLDAEILRANATIAWCDQYSEGVTGTNDKGEEVYHSPQTVEGWRRKAQSVLLNAPNRRLELLKADAQKQTFTTIKAHSDEQAKKICPEVFDKRTVEHQKAQEILALFPTVKSSPQAMEAVAWVIRGMKSMAAEQQPNGNGAKPHKDIDERVFTTPRVPVAPHTPEPPSRESRRSSQQKYNEAMSEHIKNPDGNALVAAFAALEESRRGKVGPRSRVTV